MSEYLELYDYRCSVANMYRERNTALLLREDPATVLAHFRSQKDVLFASHPQSPLDEAQRQHFRGLCYFPYNPDLCFTVDLETQVEPVRLEVTMNARETMQMVRVGQVQFSLQGMQVALSVYWLDIYGGGLFLPFRDATCPQESYGGGRYLFDTIKGSDFMSLEGHNGKRRIMLDFNYAYNPSCAYNSRWVCPLAPVENWLSVHILAGEKKFS